MADLMKGKTSYKSLVDDYSNFHVPTAKIKVNGFDVVKTLGLVVHEIIAVLSVKSASSVSILLEGLYDIGSHSFDSKIKAAFTLGTIVEVELGYLSTTRKIFKGYVEMVGVNMGAKNYYSIVLMDVKRLMMNSGRKNVLYNEKNYSDVFKKVMGAYSSLCSLDVKSTGDDLKSPISQLTDDYDFVMNDLILKGRVNREFIVFAGKAYFREPFSVSSPIMTMRLGRELTEFSVNHCYTDVKYEVIGVDDQEKPVSGSETVKSAIKKTPLVIPTPTYTFAHPYVTTKSKATTMAKALAARQKTKICIGSGTCLGIPEIVPGRYVKIENADSTYDMNYYITQVVHENTREGYTTQFDIGGCS